MTTTNGFIDELDGLNARLMELGLQPLTLELMQGVMSYYGSFQNLYRELDAIKAEPDLAGSLRAVFNAAAAPRFRPYPSTSAVQIRSQRNRAQPLPTPVDATNPAADPFRNPAYRPPMTGSEEDSSKPASDTTDPRTLSRNFDQHIVYGRNQAIQLENCAARKQAHQTINLKAAMAADQQDCKRGMAWSDAIILSLEPHEIGLLLTVLLGRLPSMRVAGHGAAHDKWMLVEQSEGEFAGAVRVQVAQGKRRVAVNVGFRDIVQVIGVCERASTDALRLRLIETPLKLARQAALYLAEQDRPKQKLGSAS